MSCGCLIEISLRLRQACVPSALEDSQAERTVSECRQEELWGFHGLSVRWNRRSLVSWVGSLSRAWPWTLQRYRGPLFCFIALMFIEGSLHIVRGVTSASAAHTWQKLGCKRCYWWGLMEGLAVYRSQVCHQESIQKRGSQSNTLRKHRVNIRFVCF